MFLDHKNRPGAEFRRRLDNALRFTQAMVPLISSHVVARRPAQNGVKRKIDHNAHYFDEPRRRHGRGVGSSLP